MQSFDTLFVHHPRLREIAPEILSSYRCLEATFASGHRLLTCGNGGSAADADHIAGELLKGFILPRRLTPAERTGLPADIADNLQRALPVIPLSGFPSLNTAYCNDCSAAHVFAQLVWALGSPGDTLLAITTSGNSANVCAAAEVARAKGMTIVALTGRDGGKIAHLADHTIIVPEQETYRIQELHLPVFHALCIALEQRFFG